jgi:integrase
MGIGSEDYESAWFLAGIDVCDPRLDRDRPGYWGGAPLVAVRQIDIVRLLILTGQRRDEIGGLRSDEIAGDRIELPAHRTKPKRAHTIPLSEPAQAILRPWAQTSANPFVFGPHPFVSWSLAKRMLDKALAKAGVEIEPWVVHDLRRSAATGMGNLSIAPHVIESVLNHSGAKADILAGIDPKLRQTYNKSAYAGPARDALVAWGEHVIAAVRTPIEDVPAAA